jgi:hypothetical protein
MPKKNKAKMETQKKEQIGFRIQKEIERQNWLKFKKEVNQKVYTRAVIDIEKDNNTIESSNFSTYIITTERGTTKLTLNKATNPPQIGSVIEFKILPYGGSYNRFYISEIVQEIKKAGEHYLFELWEIDELNKINLRWIKK